MDKQFEEQIEESQDALARETLDRMQLDESFQGVDLTLMSKYRSTDTQKQLWKQMLRRKNLPPKTSH
jgi:LAS superfamily LD-carboxypeptidase LdcB